MTKEEVIDVLEDFSKDIDGVKLVELDKVKKYISRIGGSSVKSSAITPDPLWNKKSIEIGPGSTPIYEKAPWWTNPDIKPLQPTCIGTSTSPYPSDYVTTVSNTTS